MIMYYRLSYTYLDDMVANNTLLVLKNKLMDNGWLINNELMVD